MARRVLVVVSVWLVAVAWVGAAEFWETKPFLDWSNKDVEKLMSESPWAALVSVPLPPSRPMPTVDVAGGRGGDTGGDRGFGPGPLRIRVTISWRSALPIKQAVVRSQVGLHGTVSPESQAFLTQEDSFYIVALQGLPPQYTRSGQGRTIESFLKRDGKPPIPAGQAGVQPTRGGAMLLIGFPRTSPIALEDGDVEFVVKFDELEIKKKFKLKEMVFGGRLEL